MAPLQAGNRVMPQRNVTFDYFRLTSTQQQIEDVRKILFYHGWLRTFGHFRQLPEILAKVKVCEKALSFFHRLRVGRRPKYARNS